MRIRFRFLIGLTIVLAAGWAGWWFIGSSGQKAGWEAWFADRRAAGWQAEYTTLDVAGFPNRFDTEITGLALADPRAGWAWSAPWLRIYMLSYKPNHAILTLPPLMKVSFGGETVEVLSQRLQGSLRVAARTSLALERISFELEELELQGRSGWTAAAPQGVAHVTRTPADLAPENTYDLFVEATRAELPVPLVERLDPTGGLTTLVDVLRIRARLTYDAPLDRHAVEEGRLALKAISLNEGHLDWGDISLTGNGLVEIGPDGYPDGEIDVVARGWRTMIRVGVRGGAVDEGVADALELALELVAMVTSGGRQEIETTVSFERGRVFIGPVDVGPAQRFVAPR